MAKAHYVPIPMTLPVLSAVILKIAPSRRSAMISLFRKRRKQKPREVISLAQSDTSGSGSTMILPRPSGCSSHPQNHQTTYHVILVFCLLFPSPSPGASVSFHRCKCVSLFALCRPEFESRLLNNINEMLALWALVSCCVKWGYSKTI